MKFLLPFEYGTRVVVTSDERYYNGNWHSFDPNGFALDLVAQNPNGTADFDANIVTPVEGEVVLAGWDHSGFGNTVVVKFDDGGVSRYMVFAHLSSFSVSRGDTVSKSDKLGVIGWTGNSLPRNINGTHLHWEVVNNFTYNSSGHNGYSNSNWFAVEEDSDNDPNIYEVYYSQNQPDTIAQLEPEISFTKNDFNGDGQSNILFRNESIFANAVHEVVENSSNPNYHRIHSFDNFWEYIDFGDLNNDGIVDMVVKNKVSKKISAHLMNDDGQLESYHTLHPGAGDEWSVTVGDFDGRDGEDLLYNNTITGKMSLHKTNEDGFLTTTSTVGYLDKSKGERVISKADLNGDGTDDLVTWDNHNSMRGLLIENGFVVKDSLLQNYGNDWDHVGNGYFNDDLYEDHLFINNKSGKISINLSDENGSLDGYVIPGYLESYGFESIGDYNGDGIDDILTRQVNGDSNMVVFINNNATLSHTQIVSYTSDSWEIIA